MQIDLYAKLYLLHKISVTLHKKIKFSVKDFFCKCD